MKFKLSYEDLLTKFGFGDGDILEPLALDPRWGEDLPRGEHHLSTEHEVLARCVEKFLLPELPVSVQTFRIGTCHNPIRIEPGTLDPVENRGFSVSVSAEQILEILTAVRAERS
jgi:hypothetical protein